jgi:CHASE2 domain-containing sensor protein
MKTYQSLINKFIASVSLPCLVYIFLPLAVILPLRQVGFLQPLEWVALDTVMRLRPTEAADPDIIILGIGEKDLNYLRERKETVSDSISDQALAKTLEKVSAAQPTAIGVDILRDQPTENSTAGRVHFQELQKTFQRHGNIVGIYKDQEPDPIDPIPDVSPEQLGFADSISDLDGRDRRTLLVKDGLYSLSFQLSKLHLEKQGITFNEANSQRISISNGQIIKSLQAPASIYPSEKSSHDELQMMINYHNNRKAFQIISLRDFLERDQEYNTTLKNKVVIIGYTSPALKDYSYTNAISVRETDPVHVPSIIYGVEYHGHITSQLIAYALNKRPAIIPLSADWDIYWLLCWNVMGVLSSRILSKKMFSKIKSLQFIITLAVNLIVPLLAAYGLLLLGIWVPFAATLLTFITATPVLTVANEREKSILEQKDSEFKGVLKGIRDTRNMIHETALQTLSKMISLSRGTLKAKLQQLDQQIREVSDKLEENYQNQTGIMHGIEVELQSAYQSQIEKICKEESISLDPKYFIRIDCHGIQDPAFSTQEKQSHLSFLLNKCLDDVSFYAEQGSIFSVHGDLEESEIEKDILRECFRIADFSGLQGGNLSSDEKRELATFLKEALMNVNKYAIGAIKLEVIGGIDHDSYFLSIVDNGKNTMNPGKTGLGTKNALELAKKLQGEFKRNQLNPGCECIITWPIQRKCRRLGEMLAWARQVKLLK